MKILCNFLEKLFWALSCEKFMQENFQGAFPQILNM